MKPVYDTDFAAYDLYSKVSNALKRQILHAVEPAFLQALAHPRLGFMTVTPLAMIHYMDETYGRLTLGEIEANRLALFTLWNPDRPIEDLWASIDTIRCIADDGKAPITEVTAISLLLDMFDTSGQLSSTTHKFRLSEPSTWTLEQFKQGYPHSGHQAWWGMGSMIASGPCGELVKVLIVPTVQFIFEDS
jgi:hypothetical protein